MLLGLDGSHFLAGIYVEDVNGGTDGEYETLPVAGEGASGKDQEIHFSIALGRGVVILIGAFDTTGPDAMFQDGFAGGHVPGAKVQIIAPGEEALAVGREAD